MVVTVRVGTEWVDTYPQGGGPCSEANLQFTGHVGSTFAGAMRSFGHTEMFHWGNDNAWSSDFDHPDFGGDSVNQIDNVNFAYFGGHGGHFGFDGRRVQALKFSSNHSPPGLAPCVTMSAQWRLGVKFLRWLLIDSCKLVVSTDAAHVTEVWFPPMQGIHLVLGFINLQRVGPNTYNRRAMFVSEINRGRPLANVWLETAYGWENPSDPVTRPIAIASGASRDEAINRRDGETLDWTNFLVHSPAWLAWKWRD